MDFLGFLITKNEAIIFSRSVSYILKRFLGRGIVGAAAAVLTFALIFLGTVLWKAANGPMDITELLPYLQSIIQDETGAEMQADRAYLAWDEERHNLAIRLDQIALDTNGTTIRLDRVDVSYRIPSLLQGNLLPTAVVVYRPRLIMTRDEHGNIKLQVNASKKKIEEIQSPSVSLPLESQETPEYNIDAALKPLLSKGPNHLDFVDIVDAEVSLLDIPNGKQHSIPQLNAHLERTDTGLLAHLDFLSLIGGAESHFTLTTQYEQSADLPSSQIKASLTFEDFIPNLFAKEFETVKALEGLILPLSGKVTATLPMPDPKAFSLNDLVNAEISAELVGKNGVIIAPEPYGLAYPVENLRLHANIDGPSASIMLETLELNLKDASITMGADANWKWGEASAPFELKDISANITVNLNNTLLNRFQDYWPSGIAPPARSWITENLHDGTVKSSTFEASLHGADLSSIDIKTFSGDAEVTGATIHYLRPMPPLTDVSGPIAFGLNEITISPREGHAGNLTIAPGGTVILDGLMDKYQYANIDAHILGPVQDALLLLDNKPLKLISKMGKVDPKNISGNGDTHLVMRFPLLLDLRLVDMTVNANANITNAAIKDVIPGRNLTDATMSLAVDLDKLSISGHGKVNGVPLKLGWNEKFSGTGPLTEYTMSGEIDDAGRTALGLDFIPFAVPYMQGTLIADSKASVNQKGIMTLDVQMDLTQTAMSVPGMGWRKLQGGEASGTATVRFNRDTLMDIPHFHAVTANGLEVSGNGLADYKGNLKSIVLKDITLGRSKLTGLIRFPNSGGFDADFRGPDLDLEPMIGDSDWKTLVQEEAEPNAKPEATEPAKISLTSAHTWVTKVGEMQNLKAELYRGTDGKWSGKVQGRIKNGENVTIDVRRVENARILDLKSKNAGAFLQAFDFTKSIRDGSIELTANIPDNNDPITGMGHIENFNVVDTPVVARLVSVASITGIADLINDTGVSFWKMDAPFSVDGDLVTLKDFRAEGPSFGITSQGTINTENHATNLRGKLIPINAVNQVIADIPVLGDLFGGKDGGILAMGYTIEGTLEEPDVTVDPLSAFIPGAVQRFMDKGENDYPEGRK